MTTTEAQSLAYAIGGDILGLLGFVAVILLGLGILREI